jgi:HAMP domain-containing protein
MPAASPVLRRIDEKDVAMKLIWKFNLVLLGIFVLGFAIAGYVSYRVLQANAREEIVQNARLMMEAALSSRTYTNTQVKPLLETQLKYAFLPQTVPAYAATEVFNEMRKKHPDYGYKEATLNPTNPRDRASDWEADIVNAFRQSKDNVEMVGERDTPTGRALYLARPIQITSGACLVCHSTIEVAPKTMIDQYGSANGFGWKMNEVIGAQVVSVPMSVPIKRADETFRTFMLSLAGVFVVTFVLLNAMLHVMVIRRVTRLSAIADQVSLGNLDAGEFRTRSSDEIGVLTEALGRMKVSLVQAMKMLE